MFIVIIYYIIQGNFYSYNLNFVLWYQNVNEYVCNIFYIYIFTTGTADNVLIKM